MIALHLLCVPFDLHDQLTCCLLPDCPKAALIHARFPLAPKALLLQNDNTKGNLQNVSSPKRCRGSETRDAQLLGNN
jgi:hypothetical protein